MVACVPRTRSAPEGLLRTALLRDGRKEFGAIRIDQALGLEGREHLVLVRVGHGRDGVVQDRKDGVAHGFVPKVFRRVDEHAESGRDETTFARHVDGAHGEHLGDGALREGVFERGFRRLGYRRGGGRRKKSAEGRGGGCKRGRRGAEQTASGNRNGHEDHPESWRKCRMKFCRRDVKNPFPSREGSVTGS